MKTTAQVHSNIAEVSDGYKGILLDAYGVFWGGNDVKLLPGAKEMMERLVACGKTIGILSNSTALVAKEEKKYSESGLLKGVHFHFLITSGEVARQIFLNQKLPFDCPRKTFWILGGPHPKYDSHINIFKDTVYTMTEELHEADFIYIPVPHLHGGDQTDPELFRAQVMALKGCGKPMVCANPDRFAHEGNPARQVVRQGSIGALYEEIGGEVFYIGKPYAINFEESMRYFQQHGISSPADIIMVGDTPETDIRGAQRFGMASALLTKTGIFAERIMESSLDEWVETASNEDLPDHFVETLGFKAFELHPNLKSKTFICDLPLCRVLLENEKNYPWIFLVPRRSQIAAIVDLQLEDQLQLMRELNRAQQVMRELFNPTQLNVAAIGNKTRQLHVHVIARRLDDPAWPQTVWDHPVREKYSDAEKASLSDRLCEAFN